MAHILKRLDINGFKSFGQKTTLKFPAGITAIVGPNGSGKSNVIDAIRWLLGEREAKNLRGGKVEDLIFSGTATKPRLGQAHAAIHMENEGGFFPSDFTEISIAREVSRNGVSRYFLNKSEVRLKDLIDFFAKARLGSRGLSVIGQGESDIFIKASPKGRRIMIEEILGLREYQIKKMEAERKLKNAEINLEKGLALTEEILPHLRSLKRQTARWEKRAQLEKELRELEDRYFGTHYSAIQRELREIEKRIYEHKKDFESLRAAKDKAEARLKEIEIKEPEKRGEFREVKKAMQVLLERRSELQKQLGKLEARFESEIPPQPASIPSAERLFEFIKKLKNVLQALLDKDSQEISRTLKGVLREIDQVLNELPDFSAKQFDKKSIVQELAKVKKEIAVLDKEIEELKSREASLETHQERFYSEFKEAVSLREMAKKNIENWEEEHREYTLNRERLLLRKEDILRQMAQAGRREEEFENFSTDSTPTHSDSSELEKRLFKLRGDLASIGEIDEALLKEAKETEARYEFLKNEVKDLEETRKKLLDLIAELNNTIRTKFSEALVQINQEFNKFFRLMFQGGHAKLKFTKTKEESTIINHTLGGETEGEEASRKNGEEDDEEDGIEIEVSLPRKRIHSLDMLSGGERSLTSIAALFAMISVSPPPFLVLDEVDAALDEKNSRRFADMLKEFSQKTQFIVVTHNRATMEAADVLYGITMSDDGMSKVLSLKLEREVSEAGIDK